MLVQTSFHFIRFTNLFYFFVKGCLQEEILFSIKPECLAARYFSQPLKANQALAISGARQYSRYRGYRDTFEFYGNMETIPESQIVQTRENVPRKMFSTHLTCFDAFQFSTSVRNDKDFKPKEESIGALEQQYQLKNVIRELNKALVAFSVPECNQPISTGWWGCGAFCGDQQLKFVVQWIAASVCGRSMRFHDTKIDSPLIRKGQKMVEMVLRTQRTVRWIFVVLQDYAKALKIRSVEMGLFDFILCFSGGRCK
eukprot:c9006_g1_i1.p1 GENE.c9006_g1_i1~~c9006_g1_i1.p1  ORF type:complete len:255 (+),score=39.47 c9006_g1_i1:567-1331(+)